MKIGIISDVHSNYIALDKVLNHISNKNIDSLVCTGDIIGYGPSPEKCFRRIKKECDLIIQGNHDRDVVDMEIYRMNNSAYTGLVHSDKQLTDNQIEWLQSLPAKKEYKNYLFCHSHPSHTGKYVYPEQFSSISEYMKNYDGIIMGHTHVQHAEKLKNNSIVCNPGSVGQPRDNNNKSGYAIIDTDKNKVNLYRVKYDIKKVMDKINTNNDLSNYNAERLELGK